jgi:hypothetical protein
MARILPESESSFFVCLVMSMFLKNVFISLITEFKKNVTIPMHDHHFGTILTILQDSLKAPELGKYKEHRKKI